MGASSKNELNGGSVQRVTLYDGGGNPLTPSTSGSLPITVTKVGLTPGGPQIVTVASTSAGAVPSNGTRKGLTFVNTDSSSNVISLGVGTTAVQGAGITLYPQGSWSMTDYSFSVSAINAVSSASGGKLAYQEWST